MRGTWTRIENRAMLVEENFVFLEHFDECFVDDNDTPRGSEFFNRIVIQVMLQYERYDGLICLATPVDKYL